MADAPAGPLSGVGEHRLELRKEALTMALYVAICLLASLIVIPESTAEHSNLIGLTWGITVGLALAHWFAFRVSARMAGGGTVRATDIEIIGAQLLGAASVAVVVSVGVLLLPDSVELDGAEFLLAALISLAGFAVARGAGASLPGRGLRAVRPRVRGHHCPPEEPAGRALTEPDPVSFIGASGALPLILRTRGSAGSARASR